MTKWQITRTVFKVADFLSWMHHDQLLLNPVYQRRSVWRSGAKSYLIDTVVQGVSMPIILLRDIKTDVGSRKPRREVIDGQQRLRTIASFVDPKVVTNYRPEQDSFTVSKVHNKAIANKTFDKLDPQIQQAILDYEISVHIYPNSFGDQDVRALFRRLNSTGVNLNSQELRNARFYGAFKHAMDDLSDLLLEDLKGLKLVNDYDIARMQEVEFVNEMVLYIMHGISSTSKGIIDKLYESYEESFHDKKSIESRLTKTLSELVSLHNTREFSQLFKTKTAFFAAFIFLYDCLYGIGSTLEAQPVKPIHERQIRALSVFEQNLREDSLPPEAKAAFTEGTTKKEKKLAILDYIKQQVPNAPRQGAVGRK